MTKQKLTAALALSVVYIVWGSTYFGNKVGIEGGLPPLLMIGLRYLAAGLIFFALARSKGARVIPPAEWREATLLGFLLLVCGGGLVGWSQQWISSSLAALLIATSPVWVIMLDREQAMTAQKWLGLGMGLLGVGWLVGASFTFDSAGFLWGCGACLLAALSWAAGSLRARKAPVGMSPTLRAGMQMISAGVVLILGATLSGERLVVGAITGKAWIALVLLTLFGSLTFGVYIWCMTNLSASVVSTHAYVNPVIAVLLGGLFGGEQLTLQTGMAACVAMIGVVILMLPNRPCVSKAAVRRSFQV